MKSLSVDAQSRMHGEALKSLAIVSLQHSGVRTGK